MAIASLSVSPTDPRLTIDLLTIDPAADAYAPPRLQHGLTHDDHGLLVVRPEIRAKLPPRIDALATRLLDADRVSEANSLVACKNAHKVTSFCAAGHEAEAAPIRCGKPLLHEDCAMPSARIAKFRHEHPALHRHLSDPRTAFQVLTFTIPRPDSRDHRCRMVEGRELFRRFAGTFKGDHGWQFLIGFGDGRRDTVFYALHAGDKLPPWPAINAQWQRIAPAGSTVRVRTFDGKDGDSQEDGLKLANSGFLNYWRGLAGQELAISDEFRGEDLTALYGSFRGFEAIMGDESPDAPELPRCSVCGVRHVAGHALPLMFIEELGQRFDHIRPPTYGQRGRRRAIDGDASHAPPS